MMFLWNLTVFLEKRSLAVLPKGKVNLHLHIIIYQKISRYISLYLFYMAFKASNHSQATGGTATTRIHI